ncbi:MAG TPA: hypothetical protein VM621_00735 [Luteibacter sp.]|uniref:DUF6869 domain-containing protein n=1 Tax=Luteibacter sp. TaxID=1886636 RepID=UPI002C371AB2|nr:hypothetical protein [Luteibacter sp.]HVI53559.1 hypothetical protein [Luteibacter sp.]
MNEFKDTDIARGWVEMYRMAEGSEARNTSFWAYMALDDIRGHDLERYWKIINEIRRLDDSDSVLSNLAAGPLEDLLVTSGSAFIDRCEALAKTDDRFKAMLGMVWKNSIPDDIWERVQLASTWK